MITITSMQQANDIAERVEERLAQKELPINRLDEYWLYSNLEAKDKHTGKAIYSKEVKNWRYALRQDSRLNQINFYINRNKKAEAAYKWSEAQEKAVLQAHEVLTEVTRFVEDGLIEQNNPLSDLFS
mgnify:CR=1 FL=1